MQLIKKIIILSGENGSGLVKLMFYGHKAELKAQFSLADMELGIRIGDHPILQRSFTANKCEWTFEFDYSNEPIIVTVVDPRTKSVVGGGNSICRKLTYTTDGFRFADNQRPQPLEQPTSTAPSSAEQNEPLDADFQESEPMPNDTCAMPQNEACESEGDSGEQPILSEEGSSTQNKEESQPLCPYAEFLKESDDKIAPPVVESEQTFQTLSENSEEKTSEILKKNDGDKKRKKTESSFYYAVKPQIDELFICYPREETIEQLVEDSKWVRINYEKDDYYVVGLLEEEGEVRYICYGVPAEKDIVPPKDIEDLCEYLPLDEKRGYWVMFQDAENGKTLTGNKKA